MKPSFALDLRFSVISLLHRTSRGWTKVGEVALDAPDLVEGLAFMRSTGLGLSPRGVTTKIILPHSQILYTTVIAPVAAPWARPRRIAAVLEGLTPYRLDELAYDWRETQTGLKVAVVAKETLEEAEAFARDHRFNPVSFVAVPETDAFPGEPFFGASTLSKSLLTKGDSVERDSEAVWVMARDFSQHQANVAEPDLRPEPDPRPEPQSKAKPDRTPEPVKAAPPLQQPTAPADPAPQDDIAAAPETVPQPIFVALPLPNSFDPVTTDPAPADPPKAETAAPLHAAPAQDAWDAPEPALLPQAEAAPIHSTVLDQAPIAAAEAPMALDVVPDEAPFPAPESATSEGVAQTPATPAFSAPAPPAPIDDRLRAVRPAPKPPVLVPRPAVPKLMPVKLAADRPKAARPWQAKPLPTKDKPRVPPKPAPANAAALNRSLGRQASTADQQRRYISITLTAVLVLLLAIVAIWASLSLSTNVAKNRMPNPAPVAAQSDRGADQPTAATQATSPSLPTDSAPTDSPSAHLPSATDEAAADGQMIDAEVVDLSQEITTGQGLKPEIISETSGVAALEAADQDEIFLASADTPPINLDPIALPPLDVGTNLPPSLPQDPPPYSAPTPPPAPTFEIPSIALLPTPEPPFPPQSALVSPVPSLQQPLLRPQDLVLPPPPDPAETDEGTALAQSLLAQDPTLADKRPLARPADLLPAVSLTGDADVLAPDGRYASLRPQARPADLNPAPETAVVEGLVLTTSPKPQARPADMNSGADDAVAVALNQASLSDQPAPQTASPAPSLPSNASVAQQATEKNVLDANRLALLAVFGTPTSRYAMIRLAGGRVKKVQVGDLIDGGRIAGITADTIQYQKGTRIVTLSLPQG